MALAVVAVVSAAGLALVEVGVVGRQRGRSAAPPASRPSSIPRSAPMSVDGLSPLLDRIGTAAFDDGWAVAEDVTVDDPSRADGAGCIPGGVFRGADLGHLRRWTTSIGGRYYGDMSVIVTRFGTPGQALASLDASRSSEYVACLRSGAEQRSGARSSSASAFDTGLPDALAFRVTSPQPGREVLVEDSLTLVVGRLRVTVEPCPCHVWDHRNEVTVLARAARVAADGQSLPVDQVVHDAAAGLTPDHPPDPCRAVSLEEFAAQDFGTMRQQGLADSDQLGLATCTLTGGGWFVVVRTTRPDTDLRLPPDGVPLAGVGTAAAYTGDTSRSLVVQAGHRWFSLTVIGPPESMTDDRLATLARTVVHNLGYDASA